MEDEISPIFSHIVEILDFLLLIQNLLGHLVILIKLAFLSHGDFDRNWKERRLGLGNRSHVLGLSLEIRSEKN